MAHLRFSYDASMCRGTTIENHSVREYCKSTFTRKTKTDLRGLHNLVGDLLKYHTETCIAVNKNE